MRDASVTQIKKLAVSATPAVVMMHASWCGACHKFMPLFENLASTYNKQGKGQRGGGKKVVFAKIDAHKHQKELERIKFGNVAMGGRKAVRFYPTVLLLAEDGSLASFEGERNMQNMQEVMGWYFDKYSL